MQPYPSANRMPTKSDRHDGYGAVYDLRYGSFYAAITFALPLLLWRYGCYFAGCINANGDMAPLSGYRDRLLSGRHLVYILFPPAASYLLEVGA